MDWKDIDDPKERRRQYKLWWNREERRKSRDKVLKRQRKYWCEKERDLDNWVEKPKGRMKFRTREHQIYHSAKYNAKNKNKEFDISVEDIVIPTHCPILGVKIDLDGKRSYNSPSIDRINPRLGYVKGNIQIISWRANLIKSDMTLEECEKLLEYFKNEREVCESPPTLPVWVVK